MVGFACSSDESTSEPSGPPTSIVSTASATTAPSTSTDLTTTTVLTTSTAPTTTVPAPSDATRAALGERLADELGDVNVGRRVAAELEQGTLDRLVAAAGGDLAGSPVLDYEPATAPLQQIDSIWAFSFGFRIDAGAGIDAVGLADPPPPMDVVSPGPVNAALAHVVADLVGDRPVPVVAQWEIARELAELGVQDVISVEPRVAPDGTVTYLSTPAVAEEGLQIARVMGLDMGRAGVVCVALVVGCTSEEDAGDAERFCGEVQVNAERLTQPGLQFSDDVEPFLDLYREIGELAPLAIEAEWGQLVDAYETASTVVVGDPESEQAALTSIFSTEKSAAAVDRWLESNCAVDIGPVFTIVAQDG